MLGDFFREKTTKALKAEKLRVLDQMAKEQPGSDDYHTLMNQLNALDKIESENRRGPIKWDTVFIGMCGLISTGMIMVYETRHVITQSKAWNERPRSELPKQ